MYLFTGFMAQSKSPGHLMTKKQKCQNRSYEHLCHCASGITETIDESHFYFVSNSFKCEDFRFPPFGASTNSQIALSAGVRQLECSYGMDERNYKESL